MTVTLIGRRVLLRPLVVEDYAAWTEVRSRNADWLLKWEPMRTVGAPDPVQSRDAFAVRCGARQRERQLATGYGYGIFVQGHFAGEINLNVVQRGPFQSSYVGYWIDEDRAGHGYAPEALVLLCRAAFEDLHLHRVQVSIIPRNNRQVYDMRRVLDVLVDGGRWFEVQRGHGDAIICALAHLGGEPIAIVANQPMVLAGSVDAAAVFFASSCIALAFHFQ